MAGHLAEMAALAAPDDAGVHRVHAEVFSARAAGEPSLMARGIFAWAAAESRKRSWRPAGRLRGVRRARRGALPSDGGSRPRGSWSAS
ncbi:hypothetical protein ACFPOI_31950 [Nonomuraea angiospora]|uniref:hypothetical protein n=1 Tax=Nonomuraea angiospora TaxID=46172 RepID=UPI00361C450B